MALAGQAIAANDRRDQNDEEDGADGAEDHHLLHRDVVYCDSDGLAPVGVFSCRGPCSQAKVGLPLGQSGDVGAEVGAGIDRPGVGKIGMIGLFKFEFGKIAFPTKLNISFIRVRFRTGGARDSGTLRGCRIGPEDQKTCQSPPRDAEDSTSAIRMYAILNWVCPIEADAFILCE